ncbi:Autophagy-related protein 101 [Vitis vinifera]|uniref:Autophagy-related protein 101 n=1 Tax=Vitis vinifera TaxID=29760 RepID=A0A438KRX8_VITVI|nr:Autophagy-related protein 101 [Vitis vinifera]
MTSAVVMQICLSFYEVKNKQASWFTNKIERRSWEYWYINLNVAQHPKAHSSKSHHSKAVVDPGESASEDRSLRRAALEASLREVLFQIIKFVNEKKDHIPSIPSAEGVSFPYEITIPRHSMNEVSAVLVHQFIRFCIWDGHVQEDAPKWASNHAQLIIRAQKLNHFFLISCSEESCREEPVRFSEKEVLVRPFC